MNEHLHAATWLDLGDTVSIRLDSPANVMLMDDAAYRDYDAGRSFRYLGGWVTKSQLTLWPPRAGLWHIVVDLGDDEGRVSASVQVMRG